ncbi:zinc finger CCCH domain-containing protein 25 [Amaranthus tricolor]|uniref:zinc finger CCCH domain-containing protein 25 n=1 Tax=Amaranthus tricolor TaxID=29722 RepID=UPI00258CEA6B|nr:zinc finger CCCH domain-containing protein 25 [Amaranthus tricolor]
MNPLTLVKRIQSINAKEADLGISDDASWHAKYKDSAYVFVGGIPYDLTEGDLLAVFAQYGEIVDVNLVRDKATGKSKGFAFIAYEDQRSTTLAVDNLNGASLGGRIIRVDHVAKYKKKEEEDEETERQKREERGVCRAFQRGDCKYGDSCKFSHDEQRAADTGWGPEQDRSAKWANDKFDNSMDNKRQRAIPSSHGPDRKQYDAYGGRSSRGTDNIETAQKQNKDGSSDLQDTRHKGKRSEYTEGRDRRTVERSSSRFESESKSRDGPDRQEDKRSRRTDSQPFLRETRDEKEKDKDRNRDTGRSRDTDTDRSRDRDTDRSRDRDTGRSRDRDADRSKDIDKVRDRDRDKRSSYTRDASSKHYRDDEHCRAKRDEDYRSRR